MRRFTFACLGVALLIAVGGVGASREHPPARHALGVATQKAPPSPVGQERGVPAGAVANAADVIITPRVGVTVGYRP